MRRLLHSLRVPFWLAALAALPAAAQELGPADLGPDFSSAPLAERRERARELLRNAEAGSMAGIADALGDPDARVRSTLLRFLGEVKPRDPAERDSRLVLLAEVATSDPSNEVREVALDTLGALRSEAAARTLWSLAETLPPGERAAAADRLSRLRDGRSLIASVVRRAFSESSRKGEVPAEVLVPLLFAYGRGLAEVDGGGDTPAERAPFVLGRHHPDPAVRRAAEAGLDTFLGRLRELESHERADRMLTLLLQDGLPVRDVLFVRAVTVLEEGGVDPQAALEGARELERSAIGREGWTDLRWRARAAMLEAVALLSLDRAEEAEVALLRAGDRIDGMLARRVDRKGGVTGAAEQRDLLLERSLVEFGRAFRWVSAGGAPDDLALLEILRRAHRLQLEAQLVATAGDVSSISSLEPFFNAQLSPFRLVFAVVPHEAWPPERCIRMGRALARSLASISAREVPGFVPYPDLPEELSDPVRDPGRARLLKEITLAELAALQRRFADLRAKDLLAAGDDRAVDAEMAMVSFAIRQLEIDSREKELDERFYDLRTPAPVALQLAEALRREGDTAPCRTLAGRLLAALEALELPQRYSWAVRLAARTRLVIGGSWTDENEGDLAEEEMSTALELLEGLQAHFTERAADEAAAALDDEISDALVSLAVNANVKRKDSRKALEYFERAYELHQDDFMRILLACYRARSGRFDEARELIRGIPVSPRGYYNLACTYALLGDAERALDLLERDLRENRTSEGALTKQKEWAREDPDLEALWDDPRFQWLTSPDEKETADEKD